MEKLINNLKQRAKEINSENSGLYPGKFKDSGTFEAVVAKKDYYDTDVEFIVEMFISLQKCHVFHDGNKRTSLGLFEILVQNNGFYIIDQIKLVDYQILFIENKIPKQLFKRKIYDLLDKE